MNIGAFILGIIFWQITCGIIALRSGENENIIIYTAIGIFTPICFIIGKIVRIIRLKLSRRYNAYQIFGNNSAYPDSPIWLETVYMTEKTASKFRTVEEFGHQYAIKLLQEGKDFKRYLYRSEITKEGDRFYGMSEEYFKKFLKTC